MTQFKVIKLRQKTYLKGRLRIQKFEDLINKYAAMGWPLLAFVPVDTWSLLKGEKDMFLAIFKREVETPPSNNHSPTSNHKPGDVSMKSKDSESYTYKIVPLRQKTYLKGRIRAQQFEDTLNEYSAKGWDLVRILSGKTFSILKGEKGLFLFIFRKKIQSEDKDESGEILSVSDVMAEEEAGDEADGLDDDD